jgi:hypothetical protein
MTASPGVPDLGAGGGSAAGAWASGSLRERLPRVQTGAGSGQVGEWQTVPSVWRGSSAGRGGFVFWAEFALVFRDANWDVMVGLSTAPTTSAAAPMGEPNAVFVGCDNHDNMQACRNDNSGSATCSDLGSSFPCADGVNASVLYRVQIWAAPNASSISYSLTNLDNAASASGTFSTDLPQNSVQLGGLIGAAGGGISNKVEVIGMCVIGGP